MVKLWIKSKIGLQINFNTFLQPNLYATDCYQRVCSPAKQQTTCLTKQILIQTPALETQNYIGKEEKKMFVKVIFRFSDLFFFSLTGSGYGITGYGVSRPGIQN